MIAIDSIAGTERQKSAVLARFPSAVNVRERAAVSMQNETSEAPSKTLSEKALSDGAGEASKSALQTASETRTEVRVGTSPANDDSRWLPEGTCYVGLATVRGAPHPLVFEVIDVSWSARRFAPVPNNDGGWGETRAFGGASTSDASGERHRMILRSDAAQRLVGAAPGLDEHAECV